MCADGVFPDCVRIHISQFTHLALKSAIRKNMYCFEVLSSIFESDHTVLPLKLCRETLLQNMSALLIIIILQFGPWSFRVVRRRVISFKFLWTKKPVSLLLVLPFPDMNR